MFYTSKDGTKIPMFITGRKGLARDGKTPTILYGYGGFNISLTPELLGGHARLARAWAASTRWRTCAAAASTARPGTTAGRLEHKQNVFDDFIAAAEYLIKEKYTSTPTLAISGGSNGGLLVGACMTQRPDLFGAALPAVGVMDMLRFHKFTIGWAWKSDYGSSETKPGFDTLIKYSPLQNLKPGTKLPGDARHHRRSRRPRRAGAQLQVRGGAAGRAGWTRAGADPHRDQGRPRRRQADEQADRGARRRARVHAARARRRARGGSALEPVTADGGGAPPPAAPPSISLAEATRFWLKLGFISFGGPAGQIAVMHRELVDERRWISERRFLHALSYCMLLPGPEAQQLATYIGWLLHRTWGGLIAGGLFVLPSLVILIALAWLYVAFGHVAAVAGAFAAVKPAVVAIIVQAVHRIGSRALKTPTAWAIAALSFAGMVAGVPFPILIGAAALAGAIIGRLAPGQLRAGGAHGNAAAAAGAAVIDDDTPTPSHARVHAWRLVRVIAAGLLLWAVPFAALAAPTGSAPLAGMAWFFTKAALLTFGGAYAVLPYVVQGAVHDHHWLTASQMIDGLALGETTPGPLIMVVTFVGFVGGYGQALFGDGRAWLSGVAAALVVTWFTFLPSFVLVLAGGPFVESARDDVTYVAPLAAITAAVVGVILHLAAFFGYHVFWPGGFPGAFDWRALTIALAAGVALFRFKRHVIEVILVCALAGSLLAW